MSKTNITVTSLSEYVDKVTSIESTIFYSGTTNMFPIYRGQANLEWDLSPSAYRCNRFKHEQNYIREMERVAPEAFAGMRRIDKLIKMQHFGLPTRLLDFSRNSLVALYFACSKEPEKDGAVYEVHAMPMLHQDEVLISIVMKYLFEYSNFMFNPNLFINELDEKEYPGKFYEGFRTEESILKVLSSNQGIYPKHTNERIRNQDGVFVLVGMEFSVAEGGYITFRPKKQLNIRDVSPESRSIIIPRGSKEGILRALDKVGINAKNLFPGLESETRSVVQHVEGQRFLCRGEEY